MILIVNENHIFHDRIFRCLHDRKITTTKAFIKILEALIFAAGRSEFMFSDKAESKVILNFRKEWSSHLKTFIS